MESNFSYSVPASNNRSTLKIPSTLPPLPERPNERQIAYALESLPSSSQVEAEMESPQTEIIKTVSGYFKPSFQDGFKILAGITLTAVGVAGAAVIFPLSLLGVTAGAVLGAMKSKEMGLKAADKDTILNGAIAGSLGFAAVGLFGAKLISKGGESIKNDWEAHIHRNDTESQREYFEYKNEIKAIKLEISALKSNIDNIRTDRPDLKSLESQKLNDVQANLLIHKKYNPKRLEAIDLIFTRSIGNNADFLSDIEDLHAIDNQIENAVFDLKKGGSAKIDLGDKGFFVISKGSLGDPKVIEIAMRTNQIAAGGFGIIYSMEYIHEGGPQVDQKIMKIAKDSVKAKIDVSNETQKLQDFGGKKGIQDKVVTAFEDGYIAKRLMGDVIDMLSKLGPIPAQDKIRMSKNVIDGLKYLRQKKVYHGDIKPDNMLFGVKNGKPNLVLSDFGGVKKISEILSENELHTVQDVFGTTTHGYVSDKIYHQVDNILMTAQSEIDLLEMPKDEKERLKIIKKSNVEVAALLHQNDEFAIGLSLYMLWMEEMPPIASFDNVLGFNTITQGELDLIKSDLVDNKVPKDIRKLIENFLKPGIY